MAILTPKVDTVDLFLSQNIIVDASASYDPDGGSLRFTWKWLSGPKPSLAVDETSSKARYELNTAGTYAFEVTVTDPEGLQAKDTATRIALHDVSLNACSPGRASFTPQVQLLAASPEMFEFGHITMAGSKILFAGGYLDGIHTSDVHLFDLNSKTWTKESLSDARTLFSSYSYGNLAVFAAGYQGNLIAPSVSGKVDIYDAGTGTWTRTTMPFPREGVTAAIIGKKIIMAGGNDWFYPPTDRVDILNMETGTWASSKLSEARGTMTAVNDGEKLYFGGGGLVTDCSNAIDIYDPATNQWSKSQLSESKCMMWGVPVGNRIIWAGGGEVLSRFSKRVEVYNQQGLLTGQDCISSSFYSDGNDVARLDNNTACFVNEKFIALYEPATQQWKEGQLSIPLTAVFSYQGKAYGVGAEKGKNNKMVYGIYEIRF